MSLGKIGKYEKLDVLGHGASGIVYLAWDTMLGKHVALKVITIPASDESRLLEEARVMDRLRHPNIVQVNNVDRIGAQLVIDMEYVKGTNLLQYMKQKTHIDCSEALTIAMQICDALDFAHRNHTIHRDIKPANILINTQGDVKITDFGLAEILGSGSYAGGAGTYAYMAPEDFEEVEKSDHRSDIWAIGVTLYEMITGRRPFQASKTKDPFSWKRTIEEDQPEPIFLSNTELQSKIQQVISKALSKDKYSRYQTAGEMRDDISKILAEIGIKKSVVDVSETHPKSNTYPDDIPTDVMLISSSGLSADTDMIDFGRVRANEPSRRSLVVSSTGRGRCSGKIVSLPGWISAAPTAFTRRNQRFVLTTNTNEFFDPGEYNGNIIFEVDEEKLNIPVTAEILRSRPEFYQIAWWYVPLLFFCILPLIMSLNKWYSGGITGIAVKDIIAAGLLSIMLFIISVYAEIGLWERFIPAMLGAIGLGIGIGITGQEMLHGGILEQGEIIPTAITGALLCFLIVLQLLTASKWKVWAWMLIAASITVAILLTG